MNKKSRGSDLDSNPSQKSVGADVDASEVGLGSDAGFLRKVRGDYELLTHRYSGRIRRLMVAIASRGNQAVFLYRVAYELRKRRVPVIPGLLTRLMQQICAASIRPTAEIGPGLVLVHCFGTSIGSAVRIEGDCVVFHGVTFGDRGSEWVGSRREDGHPRVGKGCIFGTHAVVLGPIRIGDNVVVGANSVVNRSVDDDTIVGGVPAKPIGRRPKMDRWLRPVDGHRDDAPRADDCPTNEAGPGGDGS